MVNVGSKLGKLGFGLKERLLPRTSSCQCVCFMSVLCKHSVGRFDLTAYGVGHGSIHVIYTELSMTTKRPPMTHVRGT